MQQEFVKDSHFDGDLGATLFPSGLAKEAEPEHDNSQWGSVFYHLPFSPLDNNFQFVYHYTYY